MRRAFFIAAIIAFACAASSVASAAIDRPPLLSSLKTTPSGTYSVRFEANMKVTMSDGVQLNVDGYIPIPREPNTTTRFPVIIFPNSWGMPIYEYIVKTMNFAQDGYIAIEYETRGWYTSGGYIDAAGPRDIADGSEILTFVLNNTNWLPDANNVAFAGVSYGAGISLSMAGADPRVKTGIIMSGWTNITNMIQPYNTPNLVWGGLLEAAADLVGHPTQDLKNLYQDALHHQNLSFIDSFCSVRSPGRFLNVLNMRKVPLFFSHNRLDRLFRSEYALDFFARLNYSEKFVMINQGVHAEPEIFGLYDIGNSLIFNYARQWLDHYLMGRPTDITQMSPVIMQHGDSMSSTEYVPFDAWPSTAVVDQVFVMSARGDDHFAPLTPLSSGQAALAAAAARRATVVKGKTGGSTSSEAIGYTGLPALTAGIPIVTALTRSFGIPYDTEILLAPTSENMIYRSEPLTADTRYCGIPKMSVMVSANQVSWQVYGFIYDVDALDIAYLVANGYYTHWGNPGDNVNVPMRLSNIPFHAICRTIPAGHRIAVGFVLYSSLFQPANSADDLTVEFHYGATNASLIMPLNPQ